MPIATSTDDLLTGIDIVDAQPFGHQVRSHGLD
jgi:hypothetical protein